MYFHAPCGVVLYCFVCKLYANKEKKKKNSTNHELLFDHLSKSIATITLQSPFSEITIFGDFDVYNPNWLTHSSHITSPAVRGAEVFALVNDLSLFTLEPTRFLDCSGDKANTLNLCLTSNPDIYSNPILDSPLGNSDHLIMVQHNFVSHQDRPSSLKKFSTLAKLTGTLFETSLLHNPGILASLMILPLLPLSTLPPFNLVWVFLFHLSIKLAKHLLQSGSIHDVQKLSNIKTTTLKNGNYTKLHIQELYLYKHVTSYSQSVMTNV